MNLRPSFVEARRRAQRPARTPYSVGTHDACRHILGRSVNAIVKTRCALAGLDPAQFSAHGLRSGYLTEAARRGVPLPEAMRQSRHRSVQQPAAYYNEVEIERGRSARLV